MDVNWAVSIRTTLCPVVQTGLCPKCMVGKRRRDAHLDLFLFLAHYSCLLRRITHSSVFFLCCFSFPFESHTFALARWGKFVIMCTLICMCFVKWCFQYKKKKRTKGNSRIWERSPRWYSEVNSLQFIIGVCLVIVSISTTEDLISTLLYMFRSVNENLIGVG